MTARMCRVEGCERPYLATGLCRAHYDRMRRTGSLGTRAVGERVVAGPCQIEGCDRLAKEKRMCGAHYHQQRRTGETWPLNSRRTRIPPRTCPSCGGEFRPSHRRCPACGLSNYKAFADRRWAPKAQGRAMTELVRLHKDEYDVLYHAFVGQMKGAES